MQNRHLFRILIAASAVFGVSPVLHAQTRMMTMAMNESAPRFLVTVGPSREPVEADVTLIPMLRRRVSIDLASVELADALRSAARQGRVSLVFASGASLTEQVRDVRMENVTLAAALTELLVGSRLDVLVESGDRITLVPTKRPIVGTVTGVVTDSITAAPVVAANVSVTGTSLRASTDATGSFSISGVPEGERELRIRRLGYAEMVRRVTVADGGTVNVEVRASAVASQLTEIVVSPTGDRLRLEIGNSIGTIKADSVVPLTLIRNVSDLLQARTPGVIVTNTTGTVGAPSRIRVRGANSIRLNNDPILIVDGVRVMSQTTQAESQTNSGNRFVQVAQAANTLNLGGSGSVGLTGAGGLAPSRLDDIDPGSIESIDILRGPSAASLYGTEAANGVIVIKTKRGATGPMRMSVIGDDGWSYVPGLLPEKWVGWGHTANGALTQRCLLSGGPFSSNVADGTCTQDSVTSFNYQNHKEMRTLGTGTTRNLSASLSGGTERLQQFLSARVSDAIGIAKMSDVEKRRFVRDGRVAPSWMQRPNTEKNMSASSRTTLRSGSKFDMSVTATGIYRDVLNNSFAGRSGESVPTYTITSLADTLQFLSAEATRARIGTDTKRGYVTTSGRYTPASWLTLRGSFGGDYTLRSDETLIRAVECSGLITCNSAHSTARNETFVTTMDIGAVFTASPFAWMTSRTSIGEQFNKTSFAGLSAGNTSTTTLGFGTDLLNPVPIAPNTTTQLYQVLESRDEGATAGWYLEQMFSLRQRLFVTAALRQDVASAFGKSVNNKPPTYPKVGVSWLLSDEPYFRFPASHYISSLRLRAAYGHSGQQAGQGDVLNNFQPATVWVRGTAVPGIILNQLGNAGLRPERTKEFEAGLDMALFNNDRVRVEGTLYRKLSEDAIVSTNLPPSYGIVTSNIFQNLLQRQNIGSVENKGAELSVTTRILDRRAVDWEVTVNASKNANRLVHKDPSARLSTSSFREGFPIYGFFGPKILSYHDLNGDGILAFSEVAWSDTTLIGKPYPDAELTYSSSLGLFSGAVRVTATVNHLVSMMTINTTDQRANFDRTTSLAAQAAAFQAVGQECCNYFGHANEVDALRFSELSLTYNLPTAIVRRFVRAQSAAITFAGRNLGLWTNYVGKDPNIDTFLGGDGFSFSEQTYDRALAIPQPRNWTVRINLGF